MVILTNQVAHLQAQLNVMQQVSTAKNILRPRPFTNKPDEEEWLLWRKHFENVAKLNGWSVTQSKLALAASLTGQASAAVQDITTDDDSQTLQQVLAAYEARFLPPSASQLARMTFDSARQIPGEDLLTYHSRLRTLWSRAYPTVADPTPLIRKFALGLQKAAVRLQTLRSAPTTYDSALQQALNEEAVQGVARAAAVGTNMAGPEPMEVDMVVDATTLPNKSYGTNNGASVRRNVAPTCFYCRKENHIARDCQLRRRENGNYPRLVRQQTRANERRIPTPQRTNTSYQPNGNRISELNGEVARMTEENVPIPFNSMVGNF